MKKAVVLSGIVLSMLSCNSPKKEEVKEEKVNTEETQEPLVGADRDEHGCITSAGFSWSELQQTCVQLWEAGVRLNPVEVKGDNSVISAFVLFNKDESKAEIILPNKEGSVILDKKSENLYEKGEYLYDNKEDALSINGKVAYKEENKIKHTKTWKSF